MNDSPDDITAAPNRWLTVPNVLCAIRFLGSWVMLWFAFRDQPHSVVVTFLFLTATDWADGKLAILLNQRSSIGPKLDTIADVTMYACLLVSTLVLHRAVLLAESAYLVAAIVSYMGSCLLSVVKFRRIPSYHTRAAKTCWLLTLIGVLSLFMDWSIWPLRIALICVTLANTEAIFITYLSDRPLSDIEHVGWVKERQRRIPNASHDEGKNVSVGRHG